MKIYIACGLTHVPRDKFTEYAAFIHTIAASLRSESHEVKYALANSDPQLALKPPAERARLCYRWDREMVEQAELTIAEASFPSIGLGIELQIAESKGIPTVLCFRDADVNRARPVKYQNPDETRHELQIGEGFLTLMALGLPTVFRVIAYQRETDGLEQILEVARLQSRN
jgi:hypothetical protein